MGRITTIVRSLSRGGRSNVCPRAKFYLGINFGGHGVCNYVREWISTRMFRRTRYLGCNSEAWHQGGYVA